MNRSHRVISRIGPGITYSFLFLSVTLRNSLKFYKAVAPDTLTKPFREITYSVGLKCRFHDLRHTFASLMLMAGGCARVVSEALGHSSVGFTLDTYSHLLPTMRKTAMSNLGKPLGPAMPEDQNVSN